MHVLFTSKIYAQRRTQWQWWKRWDLILLADENVSDLRNYHFKKHWNAKNGEPGRGSDQNGKSGLDCILKVPQGTEVVEIQSGEIICELLEHEQEFKLLEGGKRRKGKCNFQVFCEPNSATIYRRKTGMEGEFLFTLKTIADIGLVGFPNAGNLLS